MENTREFEVTLRIGECIEREGSGAITERGADALETFAAVLRAYGMEISTEYTASGKQATLTVRHPEAIKAESVRNRNPYGRPRKALDTKGHTLEELEAMTAEEGMRALGCSRRTWYRRLEALRAERG